MDKLVYFQSKQLVSGKPSVRFENDTEGDECLWLTFATSGIAIPKEHIIEYREEYTKLSDFIGQILQDHDKVKEEGR